MTYATTVSKSCVFIALVVSALSAASPMTYPSDLGTNVNTFGAYGNDNVDDTEPIRRALAEFRSEWKDFFGFPKMLYFPAGTYIVSDTISWIGCAVTIQGQGIGATIITLTDGAQGFDNPSKPRAVIATPDGNMSFRQNMYDLTINTGSNNPGAIGIDYISSNSGTVKNVAIISGDGKGITGLAMTRQWPGPCLIKNVSISGFNYGICIGCAEYGPTLEGISLEKQLIAGIQNNGNVPAIRKLISVNTVPAIVNSGFTICLDAHCSGGTGGAAIISTSTLYLRTISASGYASALKQGNTTYNGLSITEYSSDTVRSLFPSPKKSLGLAVKETPEYHDESPGSWMGFSGGSYGDNNIGPALNSGKSTIYLYGYTYLSDPVRVVKVPATVTRVIGFNAVVNGGGYTFQVEENSSEPLIIERFGYGVRVEHSCQRPVVIRHGGIGYNAKPGAGDVYFEDVESDSLVFYKGQNVYMRQLNTEGPKLHIQNNGARLWIMGIKTEGKGTVVKTTNGGFTEVLGTLLYPCQSFTATDSPAFISVESSVSFMYRISAYVPNSGYLVQVRETRNGVTKELASNGDWYTMPLFAGFDSSAVSIATIRIDKSSAGKAATLFQMHLSLSGSTLSGSNDVRQVYDILGRQTVNSHNTPFENIRSGSGMYIRPVAPSKHQHK